MERVGGKKSIVLDVRVIATSNRNLVQAIRQGDFREDLYFRLNVFPLVMPALRERSEEIPALVDYFISRHTPAGKHPPAVSIHAKAALQAYAWPGNIRELENAVQRALVLATGDILQTADFWLQDVALPMDTLLPETAMTSTAVDLVSVRKRHEYEQITAVLAETQGNRRQAAQRLGISERNLRYKLAAMRDQGYNN